MPYPRPRNRRRTAFSASFQREVPPMPRLTLPEYEMLAAQAHGHLCAGQILGLRLAMYGMRLARHRGPRRRGSQTPHHLRRDRPLRHRRHRGRHRLPAGQARAEICRFRQGRRDVLRSSERPAPFAWWRSKARASGRASGIPKSPKRTGSRCAPTGKCPTRSCSRVEWVTVDIPPEDLPGYKAPGSRARTAARRSASRAR